MAHPHVVFFPFMSKGHTIPLLHLARLFLRRGLTVTFFTTPLNSPFILESLTNTDASVVQLPFPQVVPELPQGIESTDKLPSMSFFLPFVNATKLMQQDFEQAIENLSSVICLISDGFLAWTQYSALKMGVPRYVFYGMNNFAITISQAVMRSRPHAKVSSDDEPFCVPELPWIKLTKSDLEYPFSDPEPKGPHFEFILEQVTANMQSKGYIANSFYELENKFVDYWNTEFQVKTWCVGPLGLAEPKKVQSKEKPVWMKWLDEKLKNGKSVLYLAFGTQAQISEEQLEEIALGLERAEVNFLWVVRSKVFENKKMERGLIVNEWVDQVEILSHECVNGFMSHCGWNSVLESICASVPILAWPMMAEQHLNARLVVEELGLGVRVLARNGSVRGFVGWECIEKMVKELMEGEMGKEARKKVKQMGELGRKSMEEGGSSCCALDSLIEEMQKM